MPIDSITLIEKRVGEKLLIAMDFGSWLSEGETISSINSITFDIDDGSINTTGQAISGSRIVFFVDGGIAGTRYQTKVNVTTSSGQIFIGEGPLRVLAN